MLIYKKARPASIVSKVLLLHLLLIFSPRINSEKLAGEGCLLKNEERGICKEFSDCPSSVQLSRNGVRPVICGFQEGVPIVCCGDNKQRRDSAEPVYDVQKVYQAEPNYNERKKHSVNNHGESSNEHTTGKRRTHNSNEYAPPEKPTNSYPDEETKYVPGRRPTSSSSRYIDQGSYEENTSIELHKNRKSWADQKTTNHYEYEHVTKKPSWQNQKVEDNTKFYEWQDHRETTKRNRWNENNRETTRRYDWNQGGRETTRRYERTTKRNEWPNYESTKDYGWQNQPERTTRRQIRTTTKRYDWYNQENRETTRRNEWANPENNQNWSIEQNTADVYEKRTTTRRPHYTTTENDFYLPEFRPTQRPQEHHRTTTRRPVERRRISEIKCEEYSKEAVETISGLPLTADPKPVKINVQKCLHPQQLIVGGENTTVGEFPHMAAVGFRDENHRIAWNCGGSLISEQFVMTAAHCTITGLGPPVMVRLGEYNLKRNDDGAYPVDVSIAQIIKHPDYRPPSKYNDIALLKLSRRIAFLKHIRPACLYTKETFTTSKTIATGWGRIYKGDESSDTLLKVVLSIINSHTCNQLYANTNTNMLNRGIIDSQMCAGELAGGRDTCQGDSGGPIEVTSKSNQCIHHIIGVTSFGKHCALPNAPGVYTRVSAYVPWIESIVWPQ